MTVSYPGVHYISVYTALQIIQQQYFSYYYTGQVSEYTRLNNHSGHDFIIVTGLEYIAIFNFCDFYRKIPQKLDNRRKYPLYGIDFDGLNEV